MNSVKLNHFVYFPSNLRVDNEYWPSLSAIQMIEIYWEI